MCTLVDLVDHEPRGCWQTQAMSRCPTVYSSGTIQRPGTGRTCGLETRHRHLQVLYYPDLPHRVLPPLPICPSSTSQHRHHHDQAVPVGFRFNCPPTTDIAPSHLAQLSLKPAHHSHTTIYPTTGTLPRQPVWVSLAASKHKHLYSLPSSAPATHRVADHPDFLFYTADTTPAWGLSHHVDQHPLLVPRGLLL